MPLNAPATYESWDLTPPEIPRRSRLYYLEPMGLGTPYVESLTSYIARLAAAHSVPVQILFGKEIAPVLGKAHILRKDPNTNRGCAFANARTSLPAVNGIGATAADWTRAVETLTLRKDLRFLTLLPWAQVFSHLHLLRDTRAWCPCCYAQWRKDEQLIYEPLLWLAHVVRICPYHQQPLRFHCPRCRRKLPLLDSYYRLGHCSKCGQWLGELGPVTDHDSDALRIDEREWWSWAANRVGELVAAAPNLRSVPARERVAYALSACIDQVTRGNASAFARLIQQRLTSLGSWRNGKHVPRVENLLRICHISGISLWAFLTAEVIDAKNKQATKAKLITSRLPSPVDRSKLKAALEAALRAEHPPVSVKEIAQRLGCGYSTLTIYFPDLCRAVGARYAEYRKARKKEALEKVRIALESALNNGHPPVSVKQLARHVRCSESTLRLHFPALCKAVSVRLANYRRACNEERKSHFIQEVREVVIKLYSQGIYPSHLRVLKQVARKGGITVFYMARREVLRELGIERKEFGRY